MPKKARNIEAVEPKIYGSIEYVNVSQVIGGNKELKIYADKYFRGMTAPQIPGESGMVVYLYDWNNFVKYVMWQISNNNPPPQGDQLQE